ncbi:MAG: L-threonylcarbamoyladenylate synthase [Candidatus Tectimicrobiota bacterium]
MSRLLTINPLIPEPAVIQQAVAVLQQGGVVAYLTDTVYGLAVDARQPEAIARLYTLKERPAIKALPVLIGALAQLDTLVATVPDAAARLLAAFWPGPLTLVMQPHASVPKPLLGSSAGLGVRWSAAALGQQLALGLGGAITATSANRSGCPEALSAGEVWSQLAPAVDLVLDAGPAASPVVSTVLDVTVTPPCLLRSGRVSRQALEAVLGAPVQQKTVDTC